MNDRLIAEAQLAQKTLEELLERIEAVHNKLHELSYLEVTPIRWYRNADAAVQLLREEVNKVKWNVV